MVEVVAFFNRFLKKKAHSKISKKNNWKDDFAKFKEKVEKKNAHLENILRENVR